MRDMSLVRERLEQIEEALQRIARRSSSIRSPEEFTANDDNMDRLDAIAMMLIAIGESFKRIDVETQGEYLARYSGIDWRGVIGVRNVLAHDYFDIDAEEIFNICRRDVPKLIDTVQRMLKEV